MSATNKSLVTLHAPDSPRVNLICFHHAGGSPSSFLPWKDLLPGDVGLYAAVLPGRERRFGQKHHDRVENAAKEFSTAISDAIPGDQRIVFIGHSLGGLLAHDTARQFEDSGREVDLCIVSAVSADRHRGERRWEWTDDRIIEMMDVLGGTPAEVFEHPELLELCVDILRADLRLVDTYDPADHRRIETPITAVGGATDDTVEEAGFVAWGNFTSSEFNSHLFSGGHFFLHDEPSTFTTWLMRHLATRLEF